MNLRCSAYWESSVGIKTLAWSSTPGVVKLLVSRRTAEEAKSSTTQPLKELSSLTLSESKDHQGWQGGTRGAEMHGDAQAWYDFLVCIEVIYTSRQRDAKRAGKALQFTYWHLDYSFYLFISKSELSFLCSIQSLYSNAYNIQFFGCIVKIIFLFC
jgi:hypothetical protein